MRFTVSFAEVGLALVFTGRSLTRIHCGREITRLRAAGVRPAVVRDIDVIPAWVSLVLVGGWAITVIAAAAALIG